MTENQLKPINPEPSQASGPKQGYSPVEVIEAVRKLAAEFSPRPLVVQIINAIRKMLVDAINALKGTDSLTN